MNAALPKGGQEKGDAKDLHGQAIALEDPEPWRNTVVTGEKVLEELVRTLTRYVALQDGAATAIAL